MAKTTPAARKPRAAKPAAKNTSAAKSDKQAEAAPETGAQPVPGDAAGGVEGAAQPFQGAGGAEAKPEGAAASSGGAEAKAAGEGQPGAADPASTPGAPAAQGEETREQAPAVATDRKAAAGEEKQPEETARPPVAGGASESPSLADFAGDTIVVTGPKKGRWRAGLHFGPEPTELDPADFMPAEGEPSHLVGERIYAILTDPRLTCVIRLEDGTEHPFLTEAIEQLRQAIDAAAEAE